MIYIMMNRCIEVGENEYIVFGSGKVLKRFATSSAVAERYSRRFGITPASPMDYMREVI